MTDAEFIELLWKCANYGAMLMPPDVPMSALHKEWSESLEAATAERYRRRGQT